MSRIINKAEAWETVYEAFQTVNFSAFDYNTVKQSMVEYLKLYHIENFNDFIETSEFVAILELFAYLAELVSYRLDLNAHENFISTAQRKESVLRLAKLVSYNPTRNVPARGLVKITSVQTSEAVFDSSGRNLARRKIIWNDLNNPSWKEQFLLILNRVMEQEIGSVSPADRVQVDDVVFELYKMNNVRITNGVLPFGITVSDTGVPMEIVPIELTANGPTERRPDLSAPLSIVLGNDGLGDGSDTTGFFCYTKQGSLSKITNTFDGVTPIQIYEMAFDNINETDIWVNNVDENGEIVDDATTPSLRSGEWERVELDSAANIIFNTQTSRKKYEIETLVDDQVRLIFGDGEFSDIPSGIFDIWYRTSLNEDIVIPQNTLVDIPLSVGYRDLNNNLQTLSFTVSLISTIQNASASEDLEHIRRTAPDVYYSQNRMVNGRDYNTFLLQDPTILKLRALNRTYAGESKYVPQNDASESYDNVKIFGDDLAVYYREREPADGILISTATILTGTQVFNEYLQPLLFSTDFFLVLASRGVPVSGIRTRFYDADDAAAAGQPEKDERGKIIDSIDTRPLQITNIYYSIASDLYVIDSEVGLYPDAIHMMSVGPDVGSSTYWEIRYRTKRLVAYSETTRFYNTNDANAVIDFDTLVSKKDEIIVLKPNMGYDTANGYDPTVASEVILDRNYTLHVIQQDFLDTSVPTTGLRDINRLLVMPEDANEDGISDDVEMPWLMHLRYEVAIPGGTTIITLPRLFFAADSGAYSGLQIFDKDTGDEYFITTDWDIEATTDWFHDGIDVTGIAAPGRTIIVTMKDYVYFHREDTNAPWQHIEATDANILEWYSDLPNTGDSQRYIRYEGRDGLNFLWTHFADSGRSLIDPSSTNLIDMFVLTKGYYNNVKQWLAGFNAIEPTPPTPLELRVDYARFLTNKMLSDTVIFHSCRFKVLFGDKAHTSLRARFKVIRGSGTNRLTDNELKARLVSAVRLYFEVTTWELGEQFFGTELISYLHNDLQNEVESIVIVPTGSDMKFGDLFQIAAEMDEIFYPDIQVGDIDIVDNFTPSNLRQIG